MHTRQIERKLALYTTPGNVTLGAKIAALVMVSIALFSQDLMLIFSDALQNEATSHLLIIPILVVYILYRKRKMALSAISQDTQANPTKTRHYPPIIGILLLVTAVLLYWHGSYTFTPLEYHMLALPLFTAGAVLLFFNLTTLRQLAFPIGFLLFLVPPPAELLYAVGAALSTISSEASAIIANTVGIPSTITSEYGNPTIIITRPNGSSIPFTVDIACSGIYSLIGFLIFVIFIAYLIRDKPWKKLALITAGLPLIYLLNITRITLILAIGYHYGEALALQVFHLFGGWILIFLGTLMLLAVAEKLLKTQILPAPAVTCPQCTPQTNPSHDSCWSCGKILQQRLPPPSRLDAVKIVAVITGVLLLTSIQAPVFALTEAVPLVVIDTPSGQQYSTTILPQLPIYTLSFAYRDTQFEATAKQDMSLIYLYSTADPSREPIWVTLEIAPTRSTLHRWEACLITWPLTRGYQPRVTQIDLKDVTLTENPPIISRFFVFQYTATNATQAVLYWYETATFTIDSASIQKHVKISLITYPETLDDLPAIETQMTTLAMAVAAYWQPIKTWSQITLLISRNSLTLTAVTGALIAGITSLYIYATRQQRKANRRAYRKLSQHHKQTIDAVHETQKRTVPTLANIAATYQKTTRRPIDHDQLLTNLEALEKTNIITRSVANLNDEPTRTWKAAV